MRALADEVLYTVIAPPRFEQLAFADFLQRGELDRHLRRMRVWYRRRRDVLVRALEHELPGAEVRGIAAGLHVVVVLPAGTDERRVLAEARKRGSASTASASIGRALEGPGTPARLRGLERGCDQDGGASSRQGRRGFLLQLEAVSP